MINQAMWALYRLRCYFLNGGISREEYARRSERIRNRFCV